MTLPPSFVLWVFIPGRGVVKAVCEPTTLDPETAEVRYAVLAEDDHSQQRPTYTPDEQRRLDEAADGALTALKCGMTEDAVESASLRWAERALCWHNPYPHPEDRPLPAWQE